MGTLHEEQRHPEHEASNVRLVWSATKDIHISLSNNPDNVVNVTTDDKGEIVCIFFQLAQQKKLYQKLV